MPQLLPDPWMYIFISSWVILLFMAPSKILEHTYPKDFDLNPHKTGDLSWPWLWQ
uniref:ATP synthase F0 subunit 8 n=1 Tax=Ptychadena amharensis TaxID=2806112 RepID=UPI00286A4DAC|nr:ATP synthase F0 subunit 8 [Ptychadena amharensis]WKT09056.1 ATP synthase F0 subunit 8 [Ptychadena amharensis]WKT09069.1 ATP synthase F0 subunit 8 [Ptychadena amharensis]WKT09082.1 ATP synthase F0 subunit 8 [Ptychadena amharensis]WKT09095.1 ATP synthase F0 subunit 8 [Ptychadena amharensis]WKT09108.1 ATP synthase F0 subunit 8 [Ptychadena amharensis]